MIPNSFRELRIRSRDFSLAAALVVCVVATAPASHAITITENTTGGSGATFFPGNSLTTPGGGAWNNLTFNWFSDGRGTTPTAFGTLFLLTQEYLGTPANLSAATPGFLGQSQSIVAGVYTFDQSLQLQSSSRYFFYANASGYLTGSHDVAGENNYYSYGSGDPFLAFVQDANYRLSGNAVPEPTSFILFLSGSALALGVTRRRLWNRGGIR